MPVFNAKGPKQGLFYNFLILKDYKNHLAG